MKISITLFSCLPIFLAPSLALGQETFQNLDFESALLAGFSPGLVTIERALPGWVGFIGNNQVSQVGYNTVSLGGAQVSLQSTSSLLPAIAGRYSAGLQGQFPNPNNVPGPPSAAIAQIGQIPSDAKSLVFWTESLASLTPAFNGQIVSLLQLESSSNHVVLGGDISAFAGQTGELRFTALSGSTMGGHLDNISFSTMSVPEPSTFSLIGCGILVLAFGRGVFEAMK